MPASSILTDDLPTTLLVGGRDLRIRTGHRANVKTILAFEDPDLAPDEKAAVLLNNTYLDPVPDGCLGEAVQAALTFLNGGEQDRSSGEGEQRRLFSFSGDSGLVFAAFRQTHGVDLAADELHWWVFLTLFMDLGSETAFCGLVSLRKRVWSGQATEAEVRAANEMGERFEVPESEQLPPEMMEAEDEFMRLVREGEKAAALAATQGEN